MGLSVYRYLLNSLRCQDAMMDARQELSFFKKLPAGTYFISPAVDILPGFEWIPQRKRVFCPCYTLKVDDAVSAFRERRAGHDADSTAFRERIRTEIARRDRTGYPEFDRCSGSGRLCLPAAEGKAVICASVKRRHVHLRCHVRSKDAKGCPGQRNILDPRRRQTGKQGSYRILHRNIFDHGISPHCLL